MPQTIKVSKSNHRTVYIELDTQLCKACWDCVEACPEHVIGKVNVFFHKHSRIDNSENCKGCFKCVKACPHGAITGEISKDKQEPAALPGI
ncbi:2-oxoglutarate ferredoxin oxidoreductase subunit delta [Dehalogenimonas formicexedens]|uniref:2-oxoglutarate ferredoxin oxidoreductase subunit delta n=1 Tax=Dehalogenimonas formicexedens TaxID=1839801 RepID=A0A1P8F7N1_9CHLR|nr:ferredoxin family protein [Dehalogenimonas formicexedens]APV44496.1 2-oxoglutarate ferredoxin oxidoreductase subunit delta [Dehalogenimonas formicexedens]